MIYEIHYKDADGRERYDFVPADSKEDAIRSLKEPYLSPEDIKILSINTL